MMKLFCDKCNREMAEEDSKEVTALIEFDNRTEHVSERFVLKRAEGSAGKRADLCRWCLIDAIAKQGQVDALDKKITMN